MQDSSRVTRKGFKKGQTILVGNVSAVVYDFWRTEWRIRVGKDQIFLHKETKKKTTDSHIPRWDCSLESLRKGSQFPYGWYKIVIVLILKIFILKRVLLSIHVKDSYNSYNVLSYMLLYNVITYFPNFNN